MRLVCKEVQQAVDPLIDTVVMRLGNTSISTPAAAVSIAEFHHSLPGAKHLHVHVAC